MQIVYSSRRGWRDIEHVGSAHDDAELAVLTAAARQRMAAGQGELDLGLDRTEPAGRGTGGPLPIASSRMGHLWDALAHGYRVLGFDRATDADEVFRQLVLARIIEPCRVPILSQGRDLGISRCLPGDADLDMNAFK